MVAGGKTGAATDWDSDLALETYREPIRRYIGRLIGDPDEAEDLTQETFLRAHRKLDTLRNPAALSPWLYRIATHVTYDRMRQPAFRHGKKSVSFPACEAQPEALAPDEAILRPNQLLEQHEMSECVREFLDALPAPYRDVLIHHDLLGLSNPEIAEASGISLATGKIRLHRARRKLKEALKAGCNFSYDERGSFVCDRKPSTP